MKLLYTTKPTYKRGFYLLLRRQGSNLRPSGYEPDELPLLYLALQIYGKKLYLQKIKI